MICRGHLTGPGCDVGDRRWRVRVAGKFELYQDGRGEYRFRLKAGNGEIIAVSEGYKSKAGALNGIESVRSNAPDATLDDQTGA
jgi:hypothetical protein